MAVESTVRLKKIKIAHNIFLTEATVLKLCF